MKHPMKQTIFWLICGLIVSVVVFSVVLSGLFRYLWVSGSEEIPAAADAIVENIRSENWEALQELVVDNPKIHPDCGKEGSVERLIYDAYLESLSWTCQDDFDIQGSCVTQTISVTCLDIIGLTEALEVILQAFPAESAEPEGYQQLLHSAVEQLLETGAPVRQCKITLTFQREQKQWRVIPDHAFLALLSGFSSRQR